MDSFKIVKLNFYVQLTLKTYKYISKNNKVIGIHAIGIYAYYFL